MSNEKNNLWAPWRNIYLTDKSEGGCIFCEKPNENKDRDNLILLRGTFSFVIMNLFPYNSGHLMVVPYKHSADLEELMDDEILEIRKFINMSVASIKQIMSPAGFNLGVNMGKFSGAGIAEHIHFHVVPRWIGDTNFMPVISNTKVISEFLFDTYDKLYNCLSEMEEK